MKLLSLSLIPIGCLFLAQMTQAQPEVELATRTGRVEIHYSGERAYERSGMGRCIAVKRGNQMLDGLFFSHPTRCLVYSDKNCKTRTKNEPFIYDPGYYKPAVNSGFGVCHTILK